MCIGHSRVSYGIVLKLPSQIGDTHDYNLHTLWHEAAAIEWSA